MIGLGSRRSIQSRYLLDLDSRGCLRTVTIQALFIWDGSKSSILIKFHFLRSSWVKKFINLFFKKVCLHCYCDDVIFVSNCPYLIFKGIKLRTSHGTQARAFLMRTYEDIPCFYFCSLKNLKIFFFRPTGL